MSSSAWVGREHTNSHTNSATSTGNHGRHQTYEHDTHTDAITRAAASCARLPWPHRGRESHRTEHAVPHRHGQQRRPHRPDIPRIRRRYHDPRPAAPIQPSLARVQAVLVAYRGVTIRPSSSYAGWSGYPSSSSRRLIWPSLVHCFSVGSFFGIAPSRLTLGA